MASESEWISEQVGKCRRARQPFRGVLGASAGGEHPTDRCASADADKTHRAISGLPVSR
jgi:hypothetical protein